MVPVGVHGVDVEPTASVGGEHDVAAVGGPAGPLVDAVAVGQALEGLGLEVELVDVEAAGDAGGEGDRLALVGDRIPGRGVAVGKLAGELADVPAPRVHDVDLRPPAPVR